MDWNALVGESLSWSEGVAGELLVDGALRAVVST